MRAVPKTDLLLTIDEAGARLSLGESYKKTAIQICKSIIRQSVQTAPERLQANPVGIDGDSTLVLVRDLLVEAYGAIDRAEFAPCAIGLLIPYFSNTEFRSRFQSIVKTEAWVPADNHLAMMDLVLEARDRNRCEPPYVETTFRAATVIGLIKRREVYRPERSLFFYGERIDFGPNLEPYRAIADRFIGRRDRTMLEVKRALLELVICATERFENYRITMC